MKTRLWDKGAAVDDTMLRFTVGSDPEIDSVLVRWDCIASAAHAKMLHSINLLSEEECRGLLNGLATILEQSDNGEFEIPYELEDCHTAIESALTFALGDTGKKIHSGRSRNDQVLTAMRLYLRASTVALMRTLVATVGTLLSRYQQCKDVPLPGYTHLQPAMPSSVGMWLHAFAEQGLALLGDGIHLLDAIDRSPLGAASGFGVTLPLDKNLSASLLGFSRVQRSPIDAQNSRGRGELKFCRFGADIGSMIEKIAWDLQLFSTAEFGFVRLPEKFTTGSSIMPQKRNPDVLELLRARAARIRAAGNELQEITSKLPSNYHRDFQYTKEPVLRCAADVSQSLVVLTEIIDQFELDEQRLAEAMRPELYATYDVYRRVREGTPFRDAYQQAASAAADDSFDHQALKAEFKIIAAEIDIAARSAQNELDELSEDLQQVAQELVDIESKVFLLE